MSQSLMEPFAAWAGFEKATQKVANAYGIPRGEWDDLAIAISALIDRRAYDGYSARQYRRACRADPTRLRRRHMHHQYRRRTR